MKKLFTAMLLVLLACSLCACSNGKSATADCVNGNFVGQAESDTGVLSFKGIPYAQAPVGELRWKAPEAVEASDETFDAKEYGDSSLQYYWFSEPITTDVSEDCLTLNVWTADMETANKPVMVFFHGGAFAWGGSSEGIYDGQYIVDEHSDVIVVTVNYRVGMMGFIDFSSVEGGEDFPDSSELGLLDCVESLKWIQSNISAFGGDPNNITIFGESAGGAIVSGLLASDYAGDLFQRVIAESGSLRLFYDEETCHEQTAMTEALLAVSGAENMDDLMALTTEQLIEYNETPLDEDGNAINDLYNMPLRGGKVVPEDAYDAITAAGEKGVDLLIGTNLDEQHYWVSEMGDKPLSEMTDEEIDECLYLYENYYIALLSSTVSESYSEEQLESVQEYLDMYNELEDVWAKAKFFTESVYRQPAIRIAEQHSKGGSGNTYMYLFEKTNDIADFLGSCHAQELPYVFHNFNEADVYGNVDEQLADDVCEAWVNFAKTGDPSSDTIKWEKYDTTDRKTMIIGDDNSFAIESDPMSEARKLLSWIADQKMLTEGV